ncbi:hypothetical protein B9T13_04625 [Wohlfahrtiimonas chitiniclastica]|uniref:hypothetical protein n=1 Tax=Wohlfahrtiimonas chitiniclastica TaxID=400946 RepID=UPI000B990218|nr:hypothetical protein [Wohlfahrtiimonas chitiniclastica]OYQ70548.1 hypothetical protein B9T13_04625 [Wohlfahrtiimonas chitiniclastica]
MNRLTFDSSRLKGKELAVYQAIAKDEGLNRFEAVKIGDWCLNSTISVLKKKGVPIVGQYEKVPTKHGKDVFVKRYRLASK